MRWGSSSTPGWKGLCEEEVWDVQTEGSEGAGLLLTALAGGVGETQLWCEKFSNGKSVHLL